MNWFNRLGGQQRQVGQARKQIGRVRLSLEELETRLVPALSVNISVLDNSPTPTLAANVSGGLAPFSYRWLTTGYQDILEDVAGSGSLNFSNGYVSFPANGGLSYLSTLLGTNNFTLEVDFRA